jgi:hypothetical protein
MSNPGQETDNYYQPYRDYAWRFRIWLVVYGVSAPVAIIANEHTLEKLQGSCSAKVAIFMMLAGVFIQIILTWLYKCTMWALYMAEIGVLKIIDCRAKFASDISTSFATEFIFDFLTVMLFTASSIILLNALLT